ncbi:uncharacterized protein ACWYII_017757 [Salvelinus alpinus]
MFIVLSVRIAGNGASDKNLKDGVCAQFEKNFAKAKWRKAIRVTTFMQRLRASETGGQGEGRGEDQGGGGQSLRASETAAAEVEAGGQGEGRGEDQGGGGQSEGGGVTPEVTVGTNPEREERNGGVGVRRWGEERGGGRRSPLSPSVGISPSTDNEPLSQPPNQSNASSKPLGDESKKPAVKKTSGKMAAALGQTKTTTETKTPPTPIVTPDLTKPQDPVTVSDHDTAASSLPSNAKKKQPTYVTPETPTTQRHKMGAQLHNMGPGPAATTTTTTATAITPPAPADRRPAVQAPVEEKKQDDSSWCQTQLPEAVAERPAGGGGVGGGTGFGVVSMGVGTGIEMGGGGAGTFGAGSGVLGTGLGSTVRTGIGPRGDVSPIGRDQRADRHSVEFSMYRGEPKPSEGGYSYTIGSLGSSPSLGRHTSAYGQEVELGGYGGSYRSSLYGSGGGGGMYGGLEHGGVRVRGHGSSTADWQMDSVIEQIEKQMAAVLEKIEGDMPSLLEQISDCPPPPEPPRSTHTSPSSRSRSSQHRPSHSSTSSLTSTATPPPLPTTPRPPLPSLSHLTIPPPSYPPPSLPTRSPGQPIGEHKERDGQRGAVHSSQSPSLRPGKGL